MKVNRSKDYVDKTLVLIIKPEEIASTEARRLWASTATLMEDISDDDDEVKETFYDEEARMKMGYRATLLPQRRAWKHRYRSEAVDGDQRVERENDVDNILEQPIQTLRS